MVTVAAVLERIRQKHPELRVGQILNGALQHSLGRSQCDCGNSLSSCHCKNMAGAAYDTFYISDEEMTKMLEDYEKALDS